MYTPRLYSKAIVHRYFYYYDYDGAKKILDDYRDKENTATPLEYLCALNTIFKENGYNEAREGDEWFKDNFTYSTERATARYNYDQEDGTKESVSVLQFTLTHWGKDNVSYEILFHLPFCILTSDKEIYLTELVEGILSDMEKEMSSIVSRENP